MLTENTELNPSKDALVPAATDPYYTSPGAEANEGKIRNDMISWYSVNITSV